MGVIMKLKDLIEGWGAEAQDKKREENKKAWTSLFQKLGLFKSGGEVSENLKQALYYCFNAWNATETEKVIGTPMKYPKQYSEFIEKHLDAVLVNYRKAYSPD